MSRAVGWFVIFFIVVLLATHPDSLVNLIDDTLGVIQRAGNELSAFVSRLLAEKRDLAGLARLKSAHVIRNGRGGPGRELCKWREPRFQLTAGLPHTA